MSDGIDQKLDAIINGLHKRELSEAEIKGEMKLLRQAMQSMEAQYVLVNQATNIRVQKLEEADTVLHKRIDVQDSALDALKQQATKAAVFFNFIGVVALALFNYVWYLVTGK